MKNLFEMTANGKKPYSKPMIEVVNLDGENIICASVSDPFDGITEQDW